MKEIYVAYIDVKTEKISRGQKIIRDGNALITEEGKFICAVFSDMGVKNFAPDFDGQGLERGKLIHFLTNRPVSEGSRYEWDDAEMLYENFSEWVGEDDFKQGVLYFIDSIYEERDLAKLKKAVDMLNLTKEAENYVPHNQL